MRRSASGYGAPIEAARQIIPGAIWDRLDCDFLCGADPIFVGLHRYLDATYGRSYRNTAHVAFAHNQTPLLRPDRRTTVVLPAIPTPATVVHEMGHVLHERLRFQPTARPVSSYAHTNRFEAFAEAFTAWLIPGYADPVDDPATLHLLEALLA